jgi:hypothetical protein
VAIADHVSAAGQGDILERGRAEPKKDQGAASGPPRASIGDPLTPLALLGAEKGQF